LDESNLSAYMVAPAGQEIMYAWIRTLYAGIQKAVDKGVFSGSTTQILRNRVKVISSPTLTWIMWQADHQFTGRHGQDIYGMSYTSRSWKKNIFTWSAWANLPTREKNPY